MPTPDAPRPRFDDYYQGYLGGRLLRLIDWRKVRIARDTLAELGDHPRVVDLGCGSGAIAAQLVRQLPCIDMLAADSNPRLLEMARERGLSTLQVDFDRPLPFDPDCFDAVMMVDTIEHVESRQRALREILRILKPEGTLMVFTPPYDRLAWLIGEKLHGLLTGRMTDHISPFTWESLNWLLRRNFREVSMQYVNMGLTLSAVARRRRDDADGL